MLRIRHTNKTVTNLPEDAVYIEMVNNDGKIICVLGQDRMENSMFCFDAKDVEKSKRYKKYFGVDFVEDIKVINVDQKFN